MLKSKYFKSGAVAVVVALLLGIAGIALPAVADSGNSTANKAFPGMHRGGAGAGLDQALEKADITQAEYDAMKAIQEKMGELKDDLADLSAEERQTAMKETREEVLDELLAAGTITQEVYDKMMAAQAGMGKGGPRSGLHGAGLDQALEKADITQTEYDALKAIQEKMGELKDDLADLSAEERQAAMKETREEVLDELLAAGTITQEVYDKMMAAPDDRPNPGGKGCFGGGQGGFIGRSAE
ncbi:hypothetical protein ASZ90_020161 [hydrocarbon metagenome]|uniref:Uncharacterized protein n=1 Tax=hydrocarbon metagenome TaxID=938273 RepID=A0A0W8E260_9ZZZZ